MNLIEAYRYLAALEQHRHFGRAATACHITQPALSNALRSLESHLGVAIVRRGRQYEGLTAEGEQVLATAHRVLREQELLRQELASSSLQPRGRLIMGAVPTAVPIASRFVARLVQRHPGIEPQLRSMSSQELETGLDTLALDLGVGFVDRVAGDRRFSASASFVEHYYLVHQAASAASVHQAASAASSPTVDAGTASPSPVVAEPLSWSQAAAMRLCLLTPEMHHRVLIDAVFRDLALTVRPVFQTNSVMALAVAAQASDLAAVMPGALVGTLPAKAGWVAHPLIEPELRTAVGFLRSAAARPSRALDAALALAEEPQWQAHCAEHSGALRGL